LIGLKDKTLEGGGVPGFKLMIVLKTLKSFSILPSFFYKIWKTLQDLANMAAFIHSKLTK
jgi:hypothetical protein